LNSIATFEVAQGLQPLWAVHIFQASGFAGGIWRAPGMAHLPNSRETAVTGRKVNANRARATPETGCLEEAWGRTYVRSEQRTGYMALGRRLSSRDYAKPDIRGIEPTWSRTGYGEVVCLTQGSPPALTRTTAVMVIKPTRRGDPEAGRDRGWQIHR